MNLTHGHVPVIEVWYIISSKYGVAQSV